MELNYLKINYETGDPRYILTNMDYKQNLINTFYLALPGSSKKDSAIEVTSLFIGSIDLPPINHFLAYKPAKGGEPAWWYSPDLEFKYKAATATKSMEYHVPLFQICDPAKEGVTTYNHVLFICKEVTFRPYVDKTLLLNNPGDGILLDVQLEFMQLYASLRLNPITQTPSKFMN